MKTKLTSAMMAVMASIPLFLAACTTTSPTRDTTALDRDTYARYAQNELNVWAQKAKDMPSAKANDLRANLADAQIELNRLELSGDPGWIEHRSLLDARLERIRHDFAGAEMTIRRGE